MLTPPELRSQLMNLMMVESESLDQFLRAIEANMRQNYAELHASTDRNHKLAAEEWKLMADYLEAMRLRFTHGL